MNLLGLAETAHAPHFHVDDPAGAQFDCGLGVARVVDGFIQAKAGLELLLQLRMEIKIVMPERLLDHEQVEAIEFFQVVDLAQRVGRVGVTAQQDVRPTVADLAQDLQVPARLAFYLDPPIAGGQLGFNFLQQLLV